MLRSEVSSYFRTSVTTDVSAAENLIRGCRYYREPLAPLLLIRAWLTPN